MIADFILVNDDSVNNFISQKIIKQVFPKATIQVFNDPYAALAYIKSSFTKETISDGVLFIDIKMPPLSCWEFLDAFAQLDDEVKEQLRIYILAASGDSSDRERAAKNMYVLDFIEHPLTQEKLKYVLSKL